MVEEENDALVVKLTDLTEMNINLTATNSALYRHKFKGERNLEQVFFFFFFENHSSGSPTVCCLCDWCARVKNCEPLL